MANGTFRFLDVRSAALLARAGLVVLDVAAALVSGVGRAAQLMFAAVTVTRATMFGRAAVPRRVVCAVPMLAVRRMAFVARVVATQRRRRFRRAFAQRVVFAFAVARARRHRLH